MMGLLQKACETYDCFAHLAGVVEEGKTPLAPIAHSVTSAAFDITLNQDGKLIGIEAVDKGNAKTVIPVTESSAGRTSGVSPHPLCEQLQYLMPENEKHYSAYVQQLAAWCGSPYAHPMLRPILTYVQKQTVYGDLCDLKLLKFDEDGELKKDEDKKLIRWTVVGLGEQYSGHCWTDALLQQRFIQYYANELSKKAKALCLVTGLEGAVTENHPKGIIAINGNAKLISSNDETGFTYRGRFTTGTQAASIGYEASQKAHSALRWLAANQGVLFGGRAFLCWNPKGFRVPEAHSPFLRGRSMDEKPTTPSNYKSQLSETLKGWKTDLPDDADVVIASFDAATSGRLALTYYNELRASDFLERLFHWDETCCCENGPYGVQSPSIYTLANCAFGNHRNGGLETDERILRQHAQRLIACRVEKELFPSDVEAAIVNKASRLVTYDKKTRQELLFAACAAIRKYHYDHLKEECPMSLDPTNTNRSYLFGRLLALAEAVERSTYEAGEDRETNAMRMQSIFVRRPMYAWSVLERKLAPYYARLAKNKPGLHRYFKTQIQEIADLLPADSQELNKGLEDVYLLGYYQQRAYRKDKETPVTEDNAEE